jgi:hypothetical protein
MRNRRCIPCALQESCGIHRVARLWRNVEVENATDGSACKQTAATCAVEKKATYPGCEHPRREAHSSDTTVAKLVPQCSTSAACCQTARSVVGVGPRLPGTKGLDVAGYNDAVGRTSRSRQSPNTSVTPWSARAGQLARSLSPWRRACSLSQLFATARGDFADYPFTDNFVRK